MNFQMEKSTLNAKKKINAFSITKSKEINRLFRRVAHDTNFLSDKQRCLVIEVKLDIGDRPSCCEMSHLAYASRSRQNWIDTTDKVRCGKQRKGRNFR